MPCTRNRINAILPIRECCIRTHLLQKGLCCQFLSQSSLGLCFINPRLTAWLTYLLHHLHALRGPCRPIGPLINNTSYTWTCCLTEPQICCCCHVRSAPRVCCLVPLYLLHKSSFPPLLPYLPHPCVFVPPSSFCRQVFFPSFFLIRACFPAPCRPHLPLHPPSHHLVSSSSFFLLFPVLFLHCTVLRFSLPLLLSRVATNIAHPAPPYSVHFCTCRRRPPTHSPLSFTRPPGHP